MRNTRTCSGTTHYRDGFKVFLGDVLQGRTFSPWVIGKDYDFEYRLTWIKANSDYSEFYTICPLFGHELVGKTLDEAMNKIDLIHAEEIYHEAASKFSEDIK